MACTCNPNSSAARSGATAMSAWPSATICAAAAFDAAGTNSAFGACSRTHPLTCWNATGWVAKRAAAARDCPGRVITANAMASSVSATICTPGVAASASAVAVTAPSTEFSIAHTAKSAPAPSAASAAAGESTGSYSAPSMLNWRAACSVNVPAGPR